MTNKKIFIIYHDQELIDRLIAYINEQDSDISISNKFTTDEEEVDNNNYFLDQKEVNTALKNNSLLYIITDNYISRGVTIDDVYNNDIFFMSYKEYNTISDVLFNQNDIFTIWIDSKENKPKELYSNEFYQEILYVEKRLENVDYEYFLNDSFEDILTCIKDFLEKN